MRRSRRPRSSSTGSPVTRAKVSSDGDLQRVRGVEVGRGVPPLQHAGRQHRGVLARAVHQDRGLRAAVADRPPRARRRRAGSRAGVCRADSSRPARREGAAYALDVERLPRVRGAGQGQQVRRAGRGRARPSPAPGAACCSSAAAPGRRPRRPTSRPSRRRRAPRSSRSGGPPRIRSGRSRPRRETSDGQTSRRHGRAGYPAAAVRGCAGDPALPHADRARRPGAPGLRRLRPAHPLQRARAAR